MYEMQYMSAATALGGCWFLEPRVGTEKIRSATVHVSVQQTERNDLMEEQLGAHKKWTIEQAPADWACGHSTYIWLPDPH